VSPQMTRPALDLSRLLHPSGIAVVEASADPSTMAGKPLWALVHFGYAGAVYPIHPDLKELLGLTCYSSVAEVPQPCDVALVATEPGSVPGIIADCGGAGIPFAVILTAGFGESDEAGGDLQREIAAVASAHGVRVLGPNCQGLLNARDNVYAGFSGIFDNPGLRAGPAAMVMQSGFGFALAGAAEQAGMGFSYMVSVGNEADLTAVDVLEFVLEDREIELACVYLEGVSDGDRLRDLGKRALEIAKPVLVWKIGTTTAGQRAAASHTGRLTTRNDLYRAAFREGGFIEVTDLQEMIDIAQAFRMQRLPEGRSVGVVTVTGGAGVELADRCEDRGLSLAELSGSTVERLQRLHPGVLADPGNPLDVTSTSLREPGLYRGAIDLVLADHRIDQVIACNGGIQGEIAAPATLDLVAAAGPSPKPVLVCWTPRAGSSDDSLRTLEQHKIPCYATPARVATAAAALAGFAGKLARGPIDRSPTRAVDRRRLGPLPEEGVLCEHLSGQVLAAYGIPVARGHLLPGDEVVGLRESPLPFPVAVKVDSPDVAHATEAGLVRLGIRSLDELRRASLELLDAARALGLNVHGVLVQEMTEGIEMIAGTVVDACFGPAVVLGLGGIFTEAVGEVTHQFAPFDREAARRMCDDLRAGSILRGIRGGPPADLDALADALSRLSWLAVDHLDRLAEIDVNPLFVRQQGRGVLAADASVVVRRGAME
jgi:acetate---CoA ligase (ADP-forming)